MKKFLTLMSMLFLMACNNQTDVALHDADFPGCERIHTNKVHLVYRCPEDSLKHKVVKVVEVQPDSVFKMQEGLPSVDEINAETGYTYIEVVLGESEQCVENFYYRELIKTSKKNNKLYVAIKCNT